MSELGKCRVCNKQLKEGFFTLFDDNPSYMDPEVCMVCYEREKNEAELDPANIEKKRLLREKQERRQELHRKAAVLAKDILVSTTDQIYGREINASLGIARGGTVRAKNAISDIGAGIKNVVGGELKAYTQLMADARASISFSV